MKKIIENIKERKSIHYLIIFVIGLLVSIPLLWLQVKETHDGWIHLIKLVGLDKSIQNSNFPFLVAPYICRNFGYGLVPFYPPIVIYIPYFLSILTNAFHIGIKIFAALTIPISGICMYSFINEVTKNKGISFLSAIIYMVFPYRFENIFTRFAIGEFTAFIFIPIVFKGLYNLLNGDRKKHYYIAIGAIGLILSHTISTIFTALFCAIYIIFNIKQFFKKEVIIKCIINIIFILLISSFFIIPLIEFQSQADYAIFEEELMKTSGEYTQKQTIELWQFLKDKGEENGVSFVVGIPTITMLCLTILAYKYIEKKHKDFYILNLLFGIICIFMCTNLFPWIFMPHILNNIQYPWRMIGFAMFFFTPVCAMNIYYLINCIKKEKIKNIIYVMVIIIIGIFTASRLSIYKSENKMLDKVLEKELIDNPIISHYSVNREYLPYKAAIKQHTYLRNREDRVYVLSGDAIILNENKDALKLIFEISNTSKDTQLELPYIFYPGFTVILEHNNSTQVLQTYESENGFVQITIPENIENGKITIEYTGTKLETVAYIISAVSLVGFIVYIIYSKRKTQAESLDERKN